MAHDQLQTKQSTVILDELEMRGCGQNQKYPICLGCQLQVPETSSSDSASMIIKIRHFIRVCTFIVFPFLQSKMFRTKSFL